MSGSMFVGNLVIFVYAFIVLYNLVDWASIGTTNMDSGAFIRNVFFTNQYYVYESTAFGGGTTSYFLTSNLSACL